MIFEQRETFVIMKRFAKIRFVDTKMFLSKPVKYMLV